MSREERERAEEELRQLDIKTVIGTENGRRFIWRLLSYCGIYHDIEGEQLDMLKQIGRRQVGLWLLGVLSDKQEEMVFKMMKEAKASAQEEQFRLEQEEKSGKEVTPHELPDLIDELI